MIYIIFNSEDTLYNHKIRDISTSKELESLNCINLGLIQVVNKILAIDIFNQEKIYELTEVDFFTIKKSKFATKEINIFIKALEKTNYDIVIKIKKKLDINNIYFKSILCECNYIEINDDQNGIDNYINSILNLYSIDIDANTLNLIKNNLDNDLLSVKNELIKLSTFCNPITKDIVREFSYSSLKSNGFKLIEYIINDKRVLANSLFEKLLEDGQDPFTIIGLCISQIGTISCIKLLSESKSQNSISKELSLNEYRVKMVLSSTRNTSKRKILTIIIKFAELDIKMKQGLINPELALEYLFI